MNLLSSLWWPKSVRADLDCRIQNIAEALASRLAVFTFHRVGNTLAENRLCLTREETERGKADFIEIERRTAMQRWCLLDMPPYGDDQPYIPFDQQCDAWRVCERQKSAWVEWVINRLAVETTIKGVTYVGYGRAFSREAHRRHSQAPHFFSEDELLKRWHKRDQIPCFTYSHKHLQRWNAEIRQQEQHSEVARLAAFEALEQVARTIQELRKIPDLPPDYHCLANNKNLLLSLFTSMSKAIDDLKTLEVGIRPFSKNRLAALKRLSLSVDKAEESELEKAFGEAEFRCMIEQSKIDNHKDHNSYLAERIVALENDIKVAEARNQAWNELRATKIRELEFKISVLAQQVAEAKTPRGDVCDRAVQLHASRTHWGCREEDLRHSIAEKCLWHLSLEAKDKRSFLEQAEVFQTEGKALLNRLRHNDGGIGFTWTR